MAYPYLISRQQLAETVFIFVRDTALFLLMLLVYALMANGLDSVDPALFFVLSFL